MTLFLLEPKKARSKSKQKFLAALGRWSILLGIWIVAWTIIFSGIDFWTIKLFDVCNRPWFNNYRSVMRYGVSWISPPSFALAENTYFIWVNLFDWNYQMHEWDFYTGNPINPDGHYNFVWGDNHGGWVKFPMIDWYSGWLMPTIPWLVIFTLLFARLRWAVPGEWVFARLVQFILRPQLSSAGEN